ncbi:hypothetical protein Pla110_23090 [Polystyrenella longa]|uniref:GDSL-like Lipase/Acylhydrolase n=1 Tax=Polystyrenella longa TaxID=2528007 RepID=A0A518CMX8_9PLAN|nr:SGNH/GDSL hydrolase family protein [Polystyrenella longa]QDU80578.1 hypothetical protein Pla110_23090 [Polystyrenella longa]
MFHPRQLTSLVALLTLLSLPVTSLYADEVVSSENAIVDEKANVAWYNAEQLTFEGKAFEDTAQFYDRLPARAEGVVPPSVWGLSRQSAGITVRFKTDAPVIWADWKLKSKILALAHMPALGVSGLDLYVRMEDGYRWLNAGQPTAVENKRVLINGITPEMREYMIYLPLYNGIESLSIGIPTGSQLVKVDARTEKPILFWGTSITHGASASRPGMCHPAIIGRRFDRPVINLGFSGNGRMDPEVTALIVELDPAVYIIDCLPNIQAKDVTARTAPLVRTLRAAHPDTPILLVEDRNYTNSFLVESKRTRNESSQAALQAEYDKLIAEGVKNLYYLEGDNLLGSDGDGTVDSSHPNDLGFFRQANEFERVLKPILNETK